jgi:uncharacterized protein
LHNVEKRNGSDLCLSCGLCCNAVLHHGAVMHAGEIAFADYWGMEYFSHQGRYFFRLPCLHFREGKCSIYREKHFIVCSSYQCKLLQRYLRSEIVLEDAIAMIRKVKTWQAGIETFLSPATEKESFWQRVRDWYDGIQADSSEESRRRHAEQLLQISVLNYFFQRHFWIKKNATESSVPAGLCPSEDTMEPAHRRDML